MLRIITLAISLFAMTLPAHAGGGTGSGVVNVVIRGFINAYTGGVTASRALYLGLKSGIESIGQPDAVHRDLAYMWGYDSGLSPEAAAASRSFTEYAQGFWFGFEDTVLRYTVDGRSDYEPFSVDGPGGGIDTIGDIAETRQGAEDRANGLPPSPPSLRTSG